MASANWPEVSFLLKRAGAGFFGSLLTFTDVFSPLMTTNVTGLGAAATAEFVNDSLSEGQSSSPKKDDV